MSLTSCLEKATALSPENRAAIFEAMHALNVAGMEESAASKQAVEGLIAKVEDAIAKEEAAPTPAVTVEDVPKPKVYKTRAQAEANKNGNTKRIRKVKGGYILRDATDKELAAAEKAGKRLAAGGGIDVERDSLLTAIAKRGGIAMKDRADTIGEGNKNIGGKMLFTTNGKAIDLLAIEDLRDYGYVPLREVERDGGVRWLRDAIRDEFMGTNTYFSEQGTEWMTEGQPDVSNMSDAEYDEYRQATIDDGSAWAAGEDSLADFTADDLQDAGYTALSADEQAEVEQLLADAESLGIDTEALREDAARSTVEESQEAYHAEVKRLTREAIAAARAALAGADAEAARQRGPGDGKPAGEAGQGGTEGLKRPPVAEGDRIKFTSNEGQVIVGMAVQVLDTSGGNYRIKIRTDEPAPQGGGNISRTVYSQDGTFEPEDGELLAPQTAADLKSKTDREAAAKAADAAEQRRLADKAKADAQVGEFALTGSDRAVDVAAAAGQGGLFDTPTPPVAQTATTPPIIARRMAAEQAAQSETPGWHTPLPERGEASTQQDRQHPTNPKSPVDARKVSARLSDEAFGAITQAQRTNIAVSGMTLYPWVLPAQGKRNGVVRLLPEDQKPGAPWKQVGTEPVNAGGVRNLAINDLTARLGREPIIGDENAPEAAQSAAEPVKAKPGAAKIEDVGEKIGGARKDTAVSTGTARKRTTDDEDRPAWARRFKIAQIVTPGGQINEVRDAGRWVIRDSRSLDWTGQPRQVGRDTYATKEEAEAFIPIAAVSLKHRVVMASTKKGEPDRYEIWRDITDRKRVKVVPQQFESREEAMAYMVANAAQIVETNTTFGEADLPLPPDRKRTGPERRDANVVGDDFKKTFGFRSIEFGNWNNQDERQALMNDAWDGLMDLADVLGVEPRALGLNGDLALAFGARGQGLNSARAHYETDRAVINLTKEKGAGSLAHEWFHALDHYFGRQDGKTPATWDVQPDGTRTLKAKGGDADMASGGFLRTKSGVRPEVRDAYQKLLTTMVKKAEVYVEDMAKVDKFTGQTREELARELDMLRKDLSEQKDPKYWKRNNKPASAEVLAEFDGIAKAMLDGDVLALTSDWRMIPGGDKAKTVSRWTNDSLERLSVLYKQVRGRTGFSAEKSGVLDRLRGDMTRYGQRLKMLADAQSSTEKTRMVPTEFAMNARELDQGRGGDYWTTPHELAARAFQGYVEDKVAERGGTSRFLNYAPEGAAILTPWGFKRPYPTGQERKAINAEFDNLLGVIQTRTDEAGNVALFSRAPGVAKDVANAWRILSENDEVFTYAKSDSTDFAEIANGTGAIFAEPEPGRVGADVERAWRVYPIDENGNPEKGKPAYVIHYKNGTVQLTIKNFSEGSDGSAVYAAVGNYAFNSGIVFEPDGFGLTQAAIERRLENVISLALKFGSTDFIRLSPNQLKAFKMKWRDGDTAFNTEQMLMASYNALAAKFPEIKDYTYDLETGARKSDVGAVGRDEPGTEGIVARARATGARAGERTVARAIFTNTFASEPTGKARRELVRRLGDGGGETLGNNALAKSLYSRAPDARVDLEDANDQSTAASVNSGTMLSDDGLDAVRGADGEGLSGVRGLRDRGRRNAEAAFSGGEFEGAAAQRGFGQSARNQPGRLNARTGVPIADAEAVADAIRAAYPTGPQIVVLDDVRKAPEALLDQIRAVQAANTVEGAYYKGKIYLFPQNVSDIARLMFVGAHHEIRHAGLDALFGKKKNAMMYVIAMRNPRIKAAADEKKASGLVDSMVAGVEEVLADMPLEDMAKLNGWNKIVAAVRQWLRGLADRLQRNHANLAAMIRPDQWTDNDVAALIRRAENISRGGTVPARSGATLFSQAPQTASTAFKKWFNDSKAVDAAGKPLVVYHGSGENITEFEPGRRDPGVWFTSRRETASGYAKGDEPTLHDVYLSATKPLVVDSTTFDSGSVEVDGRTFEDNVAIVKYAERAGYDSVHFPGGNFTEDDNTWVVFRPEQIKSATENNGQYDPDNADIRFSRAGTAKTTAQDLLNSNGGVFGRAGDTRQDRVRAVVDGSRPFWLGALTRDQIADMYGKEIPQIKDYDTLTRAMENQRSSMAQKADDLYQEWSRLPTEVNDRLARIMLDATVNQVHPDRENPPHKATPEQKQAHTRVRVAYKLMSKEGQAMYAKVRDAHAATLQDLKTALEGRIDRAMANGQEKAAMLADIRKRFDQYLENGPYFPLTRFGDFLVVANRDDGERVVASYESAGEQLSAARALEADGFTVKLRAAKKYNRSQDGAAGKFIGEVLATIEKTEMVEATINGSRTDLKNQLLDDINQLFIRSLPDLSYRKHFMHRKNTPGFSADVMRGFASSAFHSASHIARLNYADRMAFELEEAENAIAQAPMGDMTVASQVLNEMADRHEQMLNPSGHPLSALATQVGFTMYLGLSPAAGLINMLQVPMVALPYIGARYGFAKTTAAMSKAYTDIMGAKVNRKSGFNAAQSPKLTPAERQAISTLQDEGVIDLTQAHDLAAATERDIGNQARSRTSFAIARAMKIVGWTFHVPEVMNRQVTALMAYRLEAAKGGSVEQAMDAAREAIKRTQFDYSSSNRARYMQGNVARVVTQFKQFSQNMTYFLGRAAYQALKDEDPDVRRIARRQILSTFAVTGAMAGSMGLPGIGFFGGLLALLAGAMSDDDEPWDWKAEYRNLLADTFGKEVGEVLAKGVPRALMPAWDISGRVGLADLWWRSNDREGQNPRESFASDMSNILGPTAGSILGWYTAADHMQRGNYAKAVESIVPKFIRDPLKAGREAADGITSYSGEPLMDTTAGEDLGRILGFAPARASEMYEARNAVMNAKTVIEEKRQALLSQIAKSIIDGDRETQAELRAEISGFNARNPAFTIGTPNIIQSVLAKRRNRANTQDGILLPQSKAALRDIGRFANVE